MRSEAIPIKIPLLISSKKMRKTNEERLEYTKNTEAKHYKNSYYLCVNSYFLLFLSIHMHTTIRNSFYREMNEFFILTHM